MQTSRIIADNIRAARREAGLSQGRVAEALGLASHSAVSDLESGKRQIGAMELAQLASLLDKPIDWFFDREASHEDFVVLARAEGQPEQVKSALRSAQRLCESYLFLRRVMK